MIKNKKLKRRMRKVPKVKLNCYFCEQVFEVHPYRAETAKFCSRSCHGKYRLEQHRDRFFRDKHGENHPMWGKKLTPEWRAKISQNHANVRGENSPSWKGGVTPINERFRKTREYISWRKSVFERDDYTCKVCGDRGGHLNADHIKSFALYPDLRLDLSNGQTLCKPCHLLKNKEDMILMREESDLWE